MMTFDEIYKKHNRMVLNFLKSRVKDDMIAEELASDVMVKINKSLHKYDENLSQLSTWILNITKNCMIDHFRKRKLSVISLEEMYVDENENSQIDHLIALKESSMNPEDAMIENETSRSMYKKFELLSESEKLVASLHFFDGLSYNEVAEELNMPLGSVKAKLHNARLVMMESFPNEMRKYKSN